MKIIAVQTRSGINFHNRSWSREGGVWFALGDWLCMEIALLPLAESPSASARLTTLLAVGLTKSLRS